MRKQQSAIPCNHCISVDKFNRNRTIEEGLMPEIAYEKQIALSK